MDVLSWKDSHQWQLNLHTNALKSAQQRIPMDRTNIKKGYTDSVVRQVIQWVQEAAPIFKRRELTLAYLVLIREGSDIWIIF